MYSTFYVWKLGTTIIHDNNIYSIYENKSQTSERKHPLYCIV